MTDERAPGALSASPLLLGEGPGVRVASRLSRSDRALSLNVTGLATTLTPALSQGEREAEKIGEGLQ
jgi:hypothetical protein